MIYARYRNQLRSRTFVIDIMNVSKPKRGYTMVNATFHLENAIKKAFRDPSTRPDKVRMTGDPNNLYHSAIQHILVAFVNGLTGGNAAVVAK